MKDLVGNYLNAFNQDQPDIDKAVGFAKAIGQCGLNIVHALQNSLTFSSLAVKETEALWASSKDLCDFSDAHLVTETVDDISYQNPVGAPVVSSRATRVHIDPKIQAKIEETERQIHLMEARLESLAETANKAVQRVENIISDLGESARLALEQEKEHAHNRLSEIVITADGEVSKVAAIHESAQALAGNIAISALGKDYAASSEEEKRSANWFRNSALFFMLVVGVVLLYSIYELSVEKIQWQQALVRLAMSFAAAVPVGYLARESAKHRAQSIELRKTVHDFAALVPYLEAVHEPTKGQIRAEIARRVFFSESKADASSSFGVDPQAMFMKGMDTVVELSKQKSA